jgi:hypothetical protein
MWLNPWPLCSRSACAPRPLTEALAVSFGVELDSTSQLSGVTACHGVLEIPILNLGKDSAERLESKLPFGGCVPVQKCVT